MVIMIGDSCYILGVGPYNMALNIRDCVSLCLLDDTIKSRWSLLSGVYARGSNISQTGGGGKCVNCRGLHIIAQRRTTLKPTPVLAQTWWDVFVWRNL